ncbi:transposase [Streptomyces sp. NPDC090798]|uniref:transposase n=1 Tax=Streptomyces sp. NPDC090798 TaxID=3365968 RepID=UPI00380EFB64
MPLQDHSRNCGQSRFQGPGRSPVHPQVRSGSESSPRQCVSCRGEQDGRACAVARDRCASGAGQRLLRRRGGAGGPTVPTAAAGRGPDPAAPAADGSADAGPCPAGPGVDEFAIRKGCTYGTILVDVEAGQVVVVLPDRTSERFAAWLKEHPRAEIICRDRATAYTKAIKEVAPNALEVTDRWQPDRSSEPVRRSGEELPPALQLPAQTYRAGVGADRAGTGPNGIARAGTAPHPAHRTDPSPLRGRPPPGGEGLDHQRHRAAPEPRPQDRTPLPRRQPRRTAGLRPRPPSQRSAGAVHGIPQRPLHRGSGPGQRHPSYPGNPRTRLLRQPPGGPQAPRRSAGGHRLRSGQTSPAPARSPHGSGVPAKPSPKASAEGCWTSGSPARTSPGPATSPARSPSSSVTGADTYRWSGSARPNRTRPTVRDQTSHRAPPRRTLHRVPDSLLCGNEMTLRTAMTVRPGLRGPDKGVGCGGG